MCTEKPGRESERERQRRHLGIGFLRLKKSPVAVVSAFILHTVGFVIGLTTLAIGATAYIFENHLNDANSQLNCTITLHQSSPEFTMSVFLMVQGAILVMAAVNGCIVYTIKRCPGMEDRHGYGMVLLLAMGMLVTGILAVYSIIVMRDFFPDWLNDTSSCSYIIIITQMVAAAVDAILAAVYLITTYILICMHFYMDIAED